MSLDASPCIVLGDPSRVVDGKFSFRVEVLCGMIVPSNMSLVLDGNRRVTFKVAGLAMSPDYTINRAVASIMHAVKEPQDLLSEVTNLLNGVPGFGLGGIWKTLFGLFTGYTILMAVLAKSYMVAGIMVAIWYVGVNTYFASAYQTKELNWPDFDWFIGEELCIGWALKASMAVVSFRVISRLNFYRLVRSSNRTMTVFIHKVCLCMCPNNDYAEWLEISNKVETLLWCIMFVDSIDAVVIFILSKLICGLFTGYLESGLSRPMVVRSVERRSCLVQMIRYVMPETVEKRAYCLPQSSSSPRLRGSEGLASWFEFCGDDRWPAVEVRCDVCGTQCVYGVTHWYPISLKARVYRQVVVYESCNHFLFTISVPSKELVGENSIGRSGELVGDKGVITGQVCGENGFEIVYNGRPYQAALDGERELRKCFCNCGSFEYTDLEAKCSCCGEEFVRSEELTNGHWSSEKEFVALANERSTVCLRTYNKGKCQPLTGRVGDAGRAGLPMNIERIAFCNTCKEVILRLGEHKCNSVPSLEEVLMAYPKNLAKTHCKTCNRPTLSCEAPNEGFITEGRWAYRRSCECDKSRRKGNVYTMNGPELVVYRCDGCDEIVTGECCGKLRNWVPIGVKSLQSRVDESGDEYFPDLGQNMEGWNLSCGRYYRGMSRNPKRSVYADYFISKTCFYQRCSRCKTARVDSQPDVTCDCHVSSVEVGVQEGYLTERGVFNLKDYLDSINRVPEINRFYNDLIISTLKYHDCLVLVTVAGRKFDGFKEASDYSGVYVEDNNYWRCDNSIARVATEGYFVLPSGAITPVIHPKFCSAVSGCELGPSSSISQKRMDRLFEDEDAFEVYHQCSRNRSWAAIQSGLLIGDILSQTILHVPEAGLRLVSDELTMETISVRRGVLGAKVSHKETLRTVSVGLSGRLFASGNTKVRVSTGACHEGISYIRLQRDRLPVLTELLVSKIKKAEIGTAICDGGVYLKKLKASVYLVRGFGVHPLMFGQELPVMFFDHYALIGFFDLSDIKEVMEKVGKPSIEGETFLGPSVKFCRPVDCEYIDPKGFWCVPPEGLLFAANNWDDIKELSACLLVDQDLTATVGEASGIVGCYNPKQVVRIIDGEKEKIAKSNCVRWVSGSDVGTLIKPDVVYDISVLPREEIHRIRESLRAVRASLVVRVKFNDSIENMDYLDYVMIGSNYNCLIPCTGPGSMGTESLLDEGAIGDAETAREESESAMDYEKLSRGQMTVEQYMENRGLLFEADGIPDSLDIPDGSDRVAMSWWFDVFLMMEYCNMPGRGVFSVDLGYRLTKRSYNACVVELIVDGDVQLNDLVLRVPLCKLPKLYDIMIAKDVEVVYMGIAKTTNKKLSEIARGIASAKATTANQLKVVICLPARSVLVEFSEIKKAEATLDYDVAFGRKLKVNIRDEVAESLPMMVWNDSCDRFTRGLEQATVTWLAYGLTQPEHPSTNAIDYDTFRMHALNGDRKHWIGRVEWWGGRGFIFGKNHQLASCHHVTRTQEVVYATKHQTVSWTGGEQIKGVDVDTYNGYEFEECLIGEVYCVINPTTTEVIFLKCLASNITVDGKGEQYSRYVPVTLDANLKSCLPMELEPPKGWSGLPILSCEGKCVGVYGYGIRERVQTSSGVVKRYHAYSLPYSGTGENEEFFSKAAQETVLGHLDLCDCWLLEAPTGTGKTTCYVISLLGELVKHYKGQKLSVVLAEPMRQNVINAYNQISDAVKKCEWSKDASVSYSMGTIEGEQSSYEDPNTPKALVSLTIMTYGKFNTIYKVTDDSCLHDVVLLDEAHMRRDVDVLTATLSMSRIGRIRRGGVFGSNHGSVVVAMSATPVYDKSMKRLCGTKKILGHRHPVEVGETLLECKSEASGLVTLDLSKCANVRDSDVPQWNKKWCVPREDFTCGRVVVFADSVGNCKKLAEQIKRQIKGVPVRAYYSGCGLSVESLGEEFVLVSTDVLGVGITIPNLKVVIDLCREMKPNCRLLRNGNGVQYFWKNSPKKISKETRLQRLGRLGRTCPGKYVTFPGMELKAEDAYPEDTHVDLAFSVLHQCDIQRMPSSNCFKKREIWNIIKSYVWLHPDNEGRLPQCSMAKWKACQYVNGDGIVLYLRKHISREFEQGQLDNRNQRSWQYDSYVANSRWLRQYMSCFEADCVLETEEQCANMDRQADLELYTSRDVYGLSTENLTTEVIQELEATSASRRFVAKNQGELDEDESAYLTIIASAAAVCAVAATVVNLKADAVSTRYVTSACIMDERNVAGIASGCEQYKSKNEAWWSSIQKYWDAIQRYVRENYLKIIDMLGLDVRHEMLEEVETSSIVLIESWLMQAKVSGMAAGSMFLKVAGPFAGYAAGLGVVQGIAWDKLNIVFGNAVAPTLCALAYTSAGALIGAAAGGVGLSLAVLAYVGKALVSRETTLDRLKDAYTNRRGTSLILSGGIGLAAGYGLRVAGAVEGLSKMLTPSVVSGELQVALGSSRGAFSSSIIIVKHAYTTMRQFLSGTATEVRPESIGAAVVSTLIHIGTSGPFTCVLAGVGGAMIAVLQWYLKNNRYQVLNFLSSIKADLRNPHYEEFLGKFEESIPMMLSLAAVAAEPWSLIPVILDAVAQSLVLQTRSIDVKAAFIEGMYHFSGVGPLLGVCAVAGRVVYQLLGERDVVRTADESSLVVLTGAWISSQWGTIVRWCRHAVGKIDGLDYMWVCARNTEEGDFVEACTKWNRLSNQFESRRFKAATDATEIKEYFNLAEQLRVIPEGTGATCNDPAVIYGLRDVIPLFLDVKVRGNVNHIKTIIEATETEKDNFRLGFCWAINRFPILAQEGWISSLCEISIDQDVSTWAQEIYNSICFNCEMTDSSLKRTFLYVRDAGVKLFQLLKDSAKLVCKVVWNLIKTTLGLAKGAIEWCSKTFIHGVLDSVKGGHLLKRNDPTAFNVVETYAAEPMGDMWGAFFAKMKEFPEDIRRGVNLLHLRDKMLSINLNPIPDSEVMSLFSATAQNTMQWLEAKIPLPLEIVKICSSNFLKMVNGAECKLQGDTYIIMHEGEEIRMRYGWTPKRIRGCMMVTKMKLTTAGVYEISAEGNSDCLLRVLVGGLASKVLLEALMMYLRPLTDTRVDQVTSGDWSEQKSTEWFEMGFPRVVGTWSMLGLGKVCGSFLISLLKKERTKRPGKIFWDFVKQESFSPLQDRHGLRSVIANQQMLALVPVEELRHIAHTEYDVGDARTKFVTFGSDNMFAWKNSKSLDYLVLEPDVDTFSRLPKFVANAAAHEIDAGGYLESFTIYGGGEREVLEQLDRITKQTGSHGIYGMAGKALRSIYYPGCDCSVAYLYDKIILRGCENHSWQRKPHQHHEKVFFMNLCIKSVSEPQTRFICDMFEVVQETPKRQTLSERYGVEVFGNSMHKPEKLGGTTSTTPDREIDEVFTSEETIMGKVSSCLRRCFGRTNPRKRYHNIERFVGHCDRIRRRMQEVDAEADAEAMFYDCLDQSDIVCDETLTAEQVEEQFEREQAKRSRREPNLTPWCYNFRSWVRGQGRVPDWCTAGSLRSDVDFSVEPGELQDKYKEISREWRKWSSKGLDERVRKVVRDSRVAYPTRKIKSENNTLLYASRGVCKAQQLHEFCDELFSGQCVYDPCCGFGGFGQYYCHVNSEKSGHLYCYSSLVSEGHAVPDLSFMKSAHASCETVHVGRGTTGDIRDLQVLEDWKRMAKTHPPNVVLFDAGESSKSEHLEQEGLWWYKERKGISHLEGAKSIIELLPKGGRLCLKMLGINSRTAGILSYLAGRFSAFSVFKMPTAAETSREWYLVCKGYKPDGLNKDVVFFSRMAQYIEYELLDSALRSLSLLKRDKTKEPKVFQRPNWIRPDSTVGMECYQLSETSNKLGEKYSFSVRTGEDFDYDWSVNPQACLDDVMRGLGRRKNCMKPKIIPSSRPWKHILGLGRYGTKGAVKNRKKHPSNQLIAQWAKHVGGWTPANGTFGWTQSTKEFTDMSYEARMDRPAARPDELYMHHLVETCDTMYTEAGKEIFGQARLSTKEEVRAAINNKGATGRFCKQANLAAWIEANDDWFEQGMAVVEMWSRGERSPAYWTVRNKVETKQRKDLDSDCHLTTNGTYQELMDAGDMTPRQITFADEVSRIAHYIVLGDLLRKNAEKKVYYGSFNGLPACRIGTAMRQLWDVVSPPTAKKLNRPYDRQCDVGYVGTENELEPEGPLGASMDYSKFDFSQTLFDRMLELRFLKKFFPEHLHGVLTTMVKEFGFRVMFNDFGDIWFLYAMRASGELPTSFMNSFQASLHFRAALAKCLAMEPWEINRTIGALEISWNTHKANPEMKTYEITPFMSVWDGDDGALFTTTKHREALKNLEMYLNFGCKQMRSGASMGVSFCRKFSEMNFCSHSYTPVLIGKDLTSHRVGTVWSNPIKYAHEQDIRLWWLPDRHDALIIGKLPPTMKVNTAVYDPENEEAVEVTRGKVVSYALMYPHHRLIRAFTESMLAVLGDGRYQAYRDRNLSDDWRNVEGEPLKSSLLSLYGVSSFDDFSTRPMVVENKEWRVINSNARKIGELGIRITLLALNLGKRRRSLSDKIFFNYARWPF